MLHPGCAELVNTYTTSEKYLATRKNFISHPKVLFLMKQVKHHNGFIYHTKYKSSTVILTLVLSDIFWKIDLKAFFFFNSEYR